MKRGAKIYYGELYCPVCGTRMVIPRRGLRKQGHIKTMFCGRCGAIRDFVEETRTMDSEWITLDKTKMQPYVVPGRDEKKGEDDEQIH